jgi:hypothetical protein
VAEPQARNFGFGDLVDQDPDDIATLLDLETDRPEPGTREGATVPGDGQDSELKISPENKKKLAGELCDILTEHDSMMTERWSRDRKVEDAYALLEDSTRTGSYPGAAQMVSEMLMSAVDQAKARVYGSIVSVTPIVKVDPIETSTFAGDVATTTAAAAEDFLENYSRDELKIEDLIDVSVLRCAKIGTAVWYVNWLKSKEKYKSYGKSGKIIETERDTSRINVEIVRNQDVVLWPPWIRNWQDEYEIVGHRVQKTVSQWRVEAMRLGISEELREKVEKFSLGTAPTEDRQAATMREGIDTANVESNKGFVEYAELWCNRLLPDSDMPEKFQVFLHEGLRETLWIDCNRLHSQKHPYFPVRYKKVDGSAWGMGLGHEIAYCQAADTTFRNLEMDNLLALAFVIVLLKQGTMADALMDKAYPGMRVPTEDPDGDVKAFSLAAQGSDGLALLYQAMNQNQARKTEASGLAQVLQGQGDPTLKSGAGTGSTMALIEQAGKKFGDVDQSIRSDLTPIYAMFLDLVAQFAAEGIYYNHTSNEDASILKQLQYVPVQGTVSNYFRLRAHAPSAANNKEMAKQNLLVVDNFMMQRIQMMAGMAQMYYQSVNPAGYPEFLGKCIGALAELGEKVLVAQEVPGIKGILPEIEPPTPAEEQVNELTQQLQQAQGQLQQMQQESQMAQQQQMGMGGQMMGGEMMGGGEQMPPDQPPAQMPMPGMA